MHDVAQLAAISKHTIGGVVFILIAIALIAWGVVKIAAKAAGAVLWPLLGTLAIIIAILLFTRAI
jgi:hypothetical protein